MAQIDDSNKKSNGLKVYVETYGCSFNVSDGEVMAGLLERDGYTISPTPDGADAVIVNSCTVKDRTYLDLRKRIKGLSEGDDEKVPAVILAGCAPRVPSQAKEFSYVSQIGPNNLAALPDVLSRTLRGETVLDTPITHDDQRLELPVQRRNPHVEIIPISKGCLGQCTFCQTVIARGRLKSFPEDQILARIKKAAAEGVTQIWLTSQDCGAYGLDVGTNLAQLMRKVAMIPGDFKVRIGMANPDLIKLYQDEFVAILSDEKFFQFAHIPVQAGSDKVLEDMKRLYTVNDYRVICEKLRRRIPHITLATDMIVGFPTEADSDFQETLNIVDELKIPVINRSRFSPRPGTSAARLKMLPSKEIADRSKQLYALAKNIAFTDLDRWIGWQGDIIIEERFSKPGTLLARNFAYKPIIIKSTDKDRVRVENREGFHLHAV